MTIYHFRAGGNVFLFPLLSVSGRTFESWDRIPERLINYMRWTGCCGWNTKQYVLTTSQMPCAVSANCELEARETRQLNLVSVSVWTTNVLESVCIRQSFGRSAVQPEVWSVSPLTVKIPRLRCSQSVGRSTAESELWCVSLWAVQLPRLRFYRSVCRQISCCPVSVAFSTWAGFLILKHTSPESLHHHPHLVSNKIKPNLTKIFWRTENFFQNHY
jgi:hypothetical protein